MVHFKPNLFIPGAAKSGTTTLHNLLNNHPDICMSSNKEPVYWNNADFDNLNALVLDSTNTTFPKTKFFKGENFFSHGYEGSIDVSHSVFEDIDCETNSVNKFVLQSIENEADYIQNEIS